MSKLTKMIAIAIATAGVAGAMINTNSVDASAKTKFRYYENIKNNDYKVVNKKAIIYSNGKINHKTGAKLGAYGTYVTGYYASHVTVNGKKSVYYKFKTDSGHTGWVWRGWLKKVSYKTPTKSGSNTTPKNPVNSSSNWGQSDYDRLAKQKFSFNLSDYQQGFLDTVNKERASRGLSAMSEDSTLTDIAATRTQHILITSSHFVPNADGSITDTSYKNLDYVKLAKAAGINYAKSETIGNVNASSISHGLSSDDSIDNSTKLNTVVDSSYNAGKAMVLAYIYDDEDSDNGHRNTILNPSYNVIGIGATYTDGVVVNASVYGIK